MAPGRPVDPSAVDAPPVDTGPVTLYSTVLGVDDDAAVADLLGAVRRVAVLGVSDRFNRPSFRVAAYLLDRTAWDVTLVNPHVVETLGRLTHPSLGLLPSSPDLVVAFRAASAWADVLGEAAEVRAGAVWWCGDPPENLGDASRASGLTVVLGRDLRADHRRLR